MPPSKKEHMALVMDWDDTLCPDTISGMITSLGYDTEVYWEPLDQLVQQGWDVVTAYMKGMVDLFGQREKARSFMAEYAKTHPCFSGSDSLVRRLRDQLPENIQLHTIILSSGLRSLIEHVPMASSFEHLFASDVAYDEMDKVVFPSLVFTKGDKARLLNDLSRGRLLQSRWPQLRSNLPQIPVNKILFVGDGYTDLPCFEWLADQGGSSLAVYPRERPGGRERAEGFLRSGVVKAIAPAEYIDTSEAFQWILQQLQSMATQPTQAAP